jgi:hypothetical protein
MTLLVWIVMLFVVYAGKTKVAPVSYWRPMMREMVLVRRASVYFVTDICRCAASESLMAL